MAFCVLIFKQAQLVPTFVLLWHLIIELNVSLFSTSFWNGAYHPADVRWCYSGPILSRNVGNSLLLTYIYQSIKNHCFWATELQCNAIIRLPCSIRTLRCAIVQLLFFPITIYKNISFIFVYTIIILTEY